MRNVVLLDGHAREEGSVAVGASPPLSPGMLVEMTTDGVQAHSAVGGKVHPIAFVREQRENQGSAIVDENGDDVIIADGESCTIIYPENGARLYVVCDDTVHRGDPLTSDGNGGLKAGTSDDAIVATATEDMADGHVACVIGSVSLN